MCGRGLKRKERIWDSRHHIEQLSGRGLFRLWFKTRSVDKSWLRVFVLRRGDLQSLCITGCAVIHCTVLRGLQVVYEQRAVLRSRSTHITSDVKMFSERLLVVYSGIINVSDAFQSPVSGGFLVPVHLRVVCIFMAADELDFVSGSSEESWRSLVDFNAQTNTWKDRKINELCKECGWSGVLEWIKWLPMSQERKNSACMLTFCLNEHWEHTAFSTCSYQIYTWFT